MRKHDRWRRVFIPTFLQFVGNLSDPWTIRDNDLIFVLQMIIDNVYRDYNSENYKVSHKDVVFELVSTF